MTDIHESNIHAADAPNEENKSIAKSPVYTRRGDNGRTSLVGGVRVPKNDIRIEAYGTIDELNSQMGLLITYLTEEDDRAFGLRIQNSLFVIGSYLATDQQRYPLNPSSTMRQEMLDALEHAIDKTDSMLKPCRGFILPGGSRGAAVCNVCRTVCRRAERLILTLSETVEIDPLIKSYINRLSDYLFILGRKLNFLAHIEENIWVKRT
jgi:cob(I)alamin adenosyltransferase